MLRINKSQAHDNIASLTDCIITLPITLPIKVYSKLLSLPYAVGLSQEWTAGQYQKTFFFLSVIGLAGADLFSLTYLPAILTR